MIELLQYDFMKYALIAGLFASIACGIIGTYIVSKRIVFLSGGISHAAFGGIGLGYFLGISPLLGAVGFSIVFALLLGTASMKMKQREDTTIGVMWSFGMALGILFVYLTPGYAPDLMSYLFGSILTVSAFEILLILGLDAIIIVVVASLYKEFFAICFDEEFAKVRGVPVEKIYLVLLCLIALSVVILIRIVGVILVIAMLSIPAAISGKYTHNLKNIMFLSCFLGAVFMVLGLGLSYAFDLPSGATIILVAVAGFLISNIDTTYYKKLKIKS